MNQRICIAIVLIAFGLCLTTAQPTYGGGSGGLYGLGQQYPGGFGGFGGFGVNPYSGAYGGIGTTDPYYRNGFGSEYSGGRYGAYGNNPYGGRYGGFGGAGYGGGFQY